MIVRVLTAFALLWVSSAVAADPPAMTATPTKPGDAITVVAGTGGNQVTVDCPSGIGGMTLTRPGDSWPKAVVLRLRLKGLEDFAASAGETNFKAGVPSSGGKPTAILVRDGHETPVENAVRVVDAKGGVVAGLPPPGGWIELTLPPSLLSGDAQTITVEWIDFYRR